MSTDHTGSRASRKWLHGCSLAGLAACAGCIYGAPGDPPPPARYDLVLIGASIPETDPSGRGCRTWDCLAGAGSAPDACVIVDSRSVDRYQLTTRAVMDSLSPRWDQTIARQRTVEQLTQPFWFQMLDEDGLGDNDSIAYFMLGLSPEQVRPGPITLTAMVGGETATLTLEIR